MPQTSNAYLPEIEVDENVKSVHISSAINDITELYEQDIENIETDAITAGFSTTSTSYVDITGLSLSITTTGGDVLVMLAGGNMSLPNASDNGYIGVRVNGVDYDLCGTATLANSSGRTVPIAGHVLVTGLAAGVYTITGRAKANPGMFNINNAPVSTLRLTAIELRTS